MIFSKDIFQMLVEKGKTSITSYAKLIKNTFANMSILSFMNRLVAGNFYTTKTLMSPELFLSE